MLTPLRKKLALICVLTTGILISIMAMSILYICENQIEEQSKASFQNSVNSIIYKIQSSRLVENTWLSQLEAQSKLIIYIEDNTEPLLFQGSWNPYTSREKLIAKTQEKAFNDYSLNVEVKPYSVINVDSAFFEIKGDYKDRYHASVSIIPSAFGWQSLTVLMDRSPILNQIMIIRGSFFIIIAFSLFFLFLFSWWFSGKAILPIEESRKSQAEFIAAASHELRSPLAVIQTSISALTLGKESVENDRFIATTNRECKRMSSLISDLLFLANSDAGNWNMQIECIEIDTFLLDIYESYEQLAHVNSHKLILKLPKGEIPTLTGDKQRLWQALSVLLNNAFYYTPTGGIIVISVYFHKNTLFIQVSDNGLGIPDEGKKHIFKRFYQADTSRSNKEHYGLGLSIAKEIIEFHRGTLTVTDTTGGGATFIIKLNL